MPTVGGPDGSGDGCFGAAAVESSATSAEALVDGGEIADVEIGGVQLGGLLAERESMSLTGGVGPGERSGLSAAPTATKNVKLPNTRAPLSHGFEVARPGARE